MTELGILVFGILALACAVIAGAKLYDDDYFAAGIVLAGAVLLFLVSTSFAFRAGKQEAIVYACPKCNTEYKDEYAFCPECGAAMAEQKNNGFGEAEAGMSACMELESQILLFLNKEFNVFSTWELPSIVAALERYKSIEEYVEALDADSGVPKAKLQAILDKRKAVARTAPAAPQETPAAAQTTDIPAEAGGAAQPDGTGQLPPELLAALMGGDANALPPM